MHLERGEHVVLVGPNGSGKTTLIETIAGRRPPAAGSVRLGHKVRLGYLSQHAEEAAGEGTVFEAAQRQTGLSTQRTRDLLGAFLFSGPETEKPLAEISGGEQRRLSLAILVASGANLLVLDEPTNHLDLESREALEDALTAFEGTVLLVSHDRALLEAVGTQDAGLRGGSAARLPGAPGPSTCATARSARRAAPSRQAPAERPALPRRRRVGPSKNALRKVAELERRIEEAEAELRALEDELADPAMWSSPGRAERATERHREAKGRSSGSTRSGRRPRRQPARRLVAATWPTSRTAWRASSRSACPSGSRRGPGRVGPRSRGRRRGRGRPRSAFSADRGPGPCRCPCHGVGG